ncbi:dTMP kinase [Paracoccus sanguinis]|uniref:dTMP kinase n=1 Tax=Paracoccus sanguinis TaxID=1545044 RepID=UPI0005BC9988|nr:dTMP kinase [Paracoccus sanguinis]
MFISLEGIDGSGKSTQARRLAEALRAEGHEVVLTREPGGAPGAEDIRRLLVEGRADRWSAETELLLFTAARRDHLERTIRPALDRGAWVVSDRFADSTRVYQGATRGDLRGAVDALHALMIGVEPDRTFVIDLAPAEALARTLRRQQPGETPPAAELAAAAARAVAAPPVATLRGAEPPSTDFPSSDNAAAEDRFESMGLPFQRALRDGFRALAAAHPDRIRLIDGSGPAEAVAARVRAAL